MRMNELACTIDGGRGMSRNARQGFTLVEVLIGVVVLGLGLLGLAAIFPAVVVQQRAASEAIEGPSLVNGVRSYVGSSLQFNATSVTTVSHPAGSSPRPPGALRSLLQVDTGFDRFVPFGADGVWVTPVRTATLGDLALNIDDRGNLSIFSYFLVPSGSPTPPTTPVAAEYRIAILDRLIPSVASVPRVEGAAFAGPGEAEPRYVWDLMVRRLVVSRNPNGSLAPSEGDGLQFAVFIRRIDTGLRRPPGGSLVDLLRPANAQTPEVVPVGVSATEEWRPSLNGSGPYSLILTATLTPSQNAEPGVAPRWEVDTGAEFDGLRQVGQKLVTADGRVLTVSRVVTEGAQSLLEFEGNPLVSVGANDLDVWYTPQVPVAVDVFNPQLR
jgi:prepilin-type N-terminal cleavage/methylation domain-containing protein